MSGIEAGECSVDRSGMSGMGWLDDGDRRRLLLPLCQGSLTLTCRAFHSQVCFYFNVMPEGCRKAAEECEFAHIYLDGALEARRRAEAQGLLPPVADGCHEQPQHVRREAGDGGGLARHRIEGPSTVPHMPPPLRVPQAPAVWANGNGGGGGGNHGGGGGYPQPSLALAPSYSYHSYMATSERPAEAFPPASQGPVVYDTRPTKIYVQMPRSRTGQRVCYYHNVGRCVNPSCPFFHILVRACDEFHVCARLWYHHGGIWAWARGLRARVGLHVV